ncbi:MAG: hypothetical protein ACR2HX_00505 [Pyrinomonadaceae bacterium]
MEKIRNLVSVNHQAALIRGVQLDWYGNPRYSDENAELVSGYIFSSGSAARDSLTAISIFERVRDTLSRIETHNVFTIVAQYGHGKSHLALVLANYFGRTADDPLVEKMLKQIEASTDHQTAYPFKSFKSEAGKPQLVVRLSGHEFTNLRQGFMKALRRALDENDLSRGYEINAVSLSAARWLHSLEGEKRLEADQMLSKRYATDLNALTQSLEEFDSSKESIARDLSLKLNGVAADFGADLNLKEVIDSVITDLCLAGDAPYQKMIVLFDELGIYAEKWCHDRMAAGDLAPQQLLEACDGHKGQMCLVAFIQRELLETVKGYAAQDDFRKWAERFPPETRFRLESSLEQVIRGLLTKNPQEWGRFARDHMPRLEQESHAAWNILPTYQKNPQQWNVSKFTSVVGTGAFPLHPITTGLICNLTFTQGARTIIEVVNTVVEEKRDEDALLPGGRLNFVLPTFLVDEFAVNFKSQESRYNLYLNARGKLGANSPEKLYEVLKAIFIFEVGTLKRFENQTHADVLAQLCGYPVSDIAEALRELEQEYSVVRFVQARREYEFSGIGVSRSDVREFVRKQVAGQKIASLAAKMESLKLLDDVALPDTEAVKFKTDHGVGGKEWHLTPSLIDASKVESEHVKRIAEKSKIDGDARGTVIYVVSNDRAELEEAKETAESVLDGLQAIGNYHYPVVIAVPSSPAAEFEQELLIHDALRNVSQPQREFFGDAYKDAVSDCNRRLNDFIVAYFRYEGITYYVASAVRKTFRGVDADHLDQIASRVFEQAFPHRVPSMSDLMRLNSTPGNSAVAEVARYLLKNDGDMGGLNTAAKNLAAAVLQEGVDKWGVLNVRNRLQEPTDSRVVLSWRELDGMISEDRPTDFKALNAHLQSVPFGHDDYTLTLLYSAWIGFNKNELRFFGSLGGRNDPLRMLSLSEFQGRVTRAKDFIKWLNEGRAQIQRPGKLSKKKAEKYLQDLENVSDYTQATTLLGRVEEIVTVLPEGDVTRTSIIAQAQKLNAERKKIKDFEQEVLQYRKLVEGNTTVRNLLLIQRAYPEKPDTYLVFDDSFYVDGANLINGRLEEEVAKQTQQSLGRIEQYEAVKNGFREMRDALKQNGRQDLEQLTIEALIRVEEEYKGLVARGTEASIIAEIESLNITDATLAACRKQADRIEELLGSKLAAGSESARERVNRNLQQTNKRIGALVQWLVSLAGRTEEASDLVKVERLRDEIFRHERDYTQTPELLQLNSIKEKVEQKQNAFKEQAAAEALRQARVAEYLRIVQDRADRVVRMQSFDVAVLAANELHEVSIAPDDLALSKAQQETLDGSLRRANERIEVLYREVLQPRSPQNEQSYLAYDALLERAITAVDGFQMAPAEWGQTLMEARQRIETELTEWHVEQTRLAEENQRAESEKQRRANNRRLVDDALRQIKQAGSLRELQNAISTITDARARLIAPAEGELDKLNREEEGLQNAAAKLRWWVSEILPEELSKVATVKEVQTLRQKVVTHESLCSDEASLAESLRQARATLDGRAELFTRLNNLERQTPTLMHGEEMLRQFASLRTGYPEMIGRIQASEQSFRTRLEVLRQTERRRIEEWLKQFRVVESGQKVTAKQANDLLRSLERPPSNLEPPDEEFLTLVHEKLEAIRSLDIANRIFDDFTKLQTVEQRAECLLRLVENLKAEGLPSEYLDRLTSILELRRKAM